MRLEDKVAQYLEFCRYRKELDEKTPFPLVKDIVGYLKMCHSILPIKR